MEVFNIKNKKWIILTIWIVFIGVIFFIGYKDNSRTNVMGNVLDSIPDIDLIVAKDGKTNEQILKVPTSDDSFDKVVDIYNVVYDLKWSEKKLLKGNPFVKLDYMERDNVKFTLNIYEVTDKNISLLPNGFMTADGTRSYSYSPEESDITYIFVIEEIAQLIDVTEGMKELLNKLILNSNNLKK